MSLLSIISRMSGAPVIVSGGGDPGGGDPGGGGGTTYFEPTIEGLVYQSPTDVQGYNGFPYPLSNVSDHSLITFWKKSSTHAGAGEVAIARSINGGLTWTKGAVKVGGSFISADTLTVYKMRSSNYVILAWQTFAITPNVTYFARILESDLIANISTPNFTACGSVNYSHVNHKGYNFDNPIELPSGKMRMCYYTLPDSGFTGSKAGWIDSTDNGASWSIGNDIVVKSGGTFPNGNISESCPVITHVGATDGTTKVVVLSRNEQYGFWTHSKSSDGGNTFTTDTTWNFGYEFGGSVGSIPVSSILFNGNVYVVAGTREAPGAVNAFKLKWLIIPPDALYNNTHPLGLTPVVSSYVPNSSTFNTDVIHWGYPIVFIDWQNKLWCHVYDYVSPYIADKLKIQQLLIDSNT
jgi:hypothetical protein